FPALVELGLPEVIAAGGYPSTRSLAAWHSMASLMVLKLLRKNRVTHATELAADAALGLAVGLNVLPKATHASSYSYRVRREMNTAALTELIRRLRPLGLATGDAGFNFDFHAIRHLGTDAPLDELSARGIDWLTLRQRGKRVLDQLAALPASAWKSVRIDRAGRYRHPQLHEDTITLSGVSRPVRQIAVRNIGRDEPTLLITGD